MKKKSIETLQEVIPILESNDMHVIEENNKVLLKSKDGEKIVLQQYKKGCFSGKLKEGTLYIITDELGKTAILHPSWSYMKQGSTMSLSVQKENGQYRMIVTEDSFTLEQDIKDESRVTLWASTIPTADSDRQCFFLLVNDKDKNVKVTVSENENGAFLTTRGFVLDEDEQLPISPWICEHRGQIEQVIYDLCYPYQGTSYVEEITSFLEQEIKGTKTLVTQHCPFLGRILHKEYQDQSADTFALCMDSILVPLGLMKQEEIRTKYLRLRQKVLEEK